MYAFVTHAHAHGNKAGGVATISTSRTYANLPIRRPGPTQRRRGEGHANNVNVMNSDDDTGEEQVQHP